MSILRRGPIPTPAQRDVPIAVTALDRLRGDPYQFYAGSILKLRALDALDAEPSPAWQGTVAHAILERWHREGGALADVADAVLDANNAHPLMRGLWLPRLLAALEWVERSLADDPERTIVAVEQSGSMLVDGVKIHGRADRIDRMADGTLAIVDYKTGSPPSARMVAEGFALQLGLIGLMAQSGGFEGVSGEPGRFEYWSMGRSDKSDTGFGYIASPLKLTTRQSGLEPDEFLPAAKRDLHDAIARFIKGREPFEAKLNPDYPGYTDYDQLMRLDEWQGQRDGGGIVSGAVYPLHGNQRDAVNPRESVWLSASAGTGKTQVLSARVLRLLLEPGNDPSQILCLTFTKAGAAEMAERVNEVLARWVRLPDAKLATELDHVGAATDPATVSRARSLFAHVLDTPGGGLRIDTIHAFAQWLLAAFPQEAGIAPGSKAMEDRDRDLLAREVLSDMVLTAQRQGDDRHAECDGGLRAAQGCRRVESVVDALRRRGAVVDRAGRLAGPDAPAPVCDAGAAGRRRRTKRGASCAATMRFR